MERVVQGFEVVGVAILVVGSLLAFVSAALGLRGGDGRAAYQRVTLASDYAACATAVPSRGARRQA
jgi:hypothetical protein